jgi:tRNA modification GTPase
MLTFDPICAIATPPGAAGLAIVRLSGDACFAIADTCFRGKTSISAARSHTILYGTFWRSAVAIDQITAFVYCAPHSYTGENVVEIGCHGGTIVAHEIVEALLEAGARQVNLPNVRF